MDEGEDTAEEGGTEGDGFWDWWYTGTEQTHAQRSQQNHVHYLHCSCCHMVSSCQTVCL